MEEPVVKKHDIIVYGTGDEIPPDCVVINPTSRSKEEWMKAFSPFYLGPISLYQGMQSLNLENAWQYSKVYPIHSTDPTYVIPSSPPHPNDCPAPAKEYFIWAKEGWNNPTPKRFPMGRGAIPMYSYWDGQRMGYIEARIKIYCTLYAAAVEKTKEWGRLKKIYEKVKAEGKTLAIFDFDGHNSLEILNSFESILYNYKMKMGHSFVLAMMLTGDRAWENGSYDSSKIHFTKIPKRKNSPEIPSDIQKSDED